MNIDTVHITENFQTSNCKYNYIKKKFDNELTPNNEAHYFKSNVKASYYNYENFVISLTNNRLKCIGSLPKLVNNNNIEDLDIKAIKFGFQKLEKGLGISLENSLVSRIDSSSVLQMHHKPCEYYKMFVKPKGFKEVKYEGESFEYNKQGFKIAFYDKTIETKRAYLPLAFRNKNLLKYELQIYASKFALHGLPIISVKDLYNKDVLAKVVNIWYDTYKSIPKLSQTNCSNINYNKKSDWKESYILEGISTAGGFDKAIADLHENAVGKTKWSILKYLNELKIQNLNKAISYDLVQELDEKIFCKYEELLYKVGIG